MKPNTPAERLYNGIIKENPTFVLMLGMCPTLAITTSATNGIGMGLGFTVGLTSIGIVRELIGSGKIFGMTVFNGGATIFILAPGAFFVLAMLVALQNRVKMKKDPAAAPKACDESLCAGCSNHMCASKKSAEKGGNQS